MHIQTLKLASYHVMSKLLLLSYKVKVFQLMWGLHVVPNFIFKNFCSTLIFSNFPNFNLKIYVEYFLFQYLLQNLSFLFSIFFTNLIICISCFTIFCRYFIAEYIYTNKLDELFLCLYNFLFKHIK